MTWWIWYVITFFSLLFSFCIYAYAFAEQKERKSPSEPSNCPILVIDEANELMKLEKNEDVLKSFLKAVTAATKQKKKVHVVLGTSDSYFLHWLSNLASDDSTNVIVVSDLGKEEAWKYWKHSVFKEKKDSGSLDRTEREKEDAEELRERKIFEETYKVLGGNILRLKEYLRKRQQANKVLDPSSLEAVQDAKDKWVTMLDPGRDISYVTLTVCCFDIFECINLLLLGAVE